MVYVEVKIFNLTKSNISQNRSSQNRIHTVIFLIQSYLMNVYYKNYSLKFKQHHQFNDNCSLKFLNYEKITQNIKTKISESNESYLIKGLTFK